MDYRCKFCGKITLTPAGLARHITIKHRQPVVIEVEALQNSILSVIDTIKESFGTVHQAMNAQGKASFKRDLELLEEIKVISRDSAKHDQDIAHLKAKQSKVKLVEV